jgi:DNA-binding NtrC family response regulator
VPHLLWVEDDAALRRIYRPTLQAEGYTVSEAGDPEAALAALRRSPPDLVLLDLMLPPAQRPEVGLALLDQLLARQPGLKVIVATGSGGRDVGLKAIRRGAHDMLHMPVDPYVLIVVLKRAATLEAKMLHGLPHAGDDVLGLVVAELLAARNRIQTHRNRSVVLVDPDSFGRLHRRRGRLLLFRWHVERPERTSLFQDAARKHGLFGTLSFTRN